VRACFLPLFEPLRVVLLHLPYTHITIYTCHSVARKTMPRPQHTGCQTDTAQETKDGCEQRKAGARAHGGHACPTLGPPMRAARARLLLAAEQPALRWSLLVDTCPTRHTYTHTNTKGLFDERARGAGREGISRRRGRRLGASWRQTSWIAPPRASPTPADTSTPDSS